MDEIWKKELLEASRRLDQDQVNKFLNLVNQAAGKCSLDVARIFMKTFSDQPDYGTQERVVNVLSTAHDKIVIQAILEELPRLYKEAPEWAESLIGLEIDKRAALVEEIVKKMPEDIKKILKKFCSSKDFYEFYPAAKTIKL